MKRYMMFLILALLTCFATTGHAIVLSETGTGADSAYQMQVQIDLTEYEAGQEFLVWQKTLDGGGDDSTYAHLITTTSRLFTVNVDSSGVYYFKVQARKRVFQNGSYRLVTTPFDEAPEASIKVFGNAYEFYNLTVANNIIYPSTVPIIKGLYFEYDSGYGIVTWYPGTIMYDSRVFEVSGGGPEGAYKFYVWPNDTDSTTIKGTNSEPDINEWIVAAIDTVTDELYIPATYRLLYGQTIRAGTITADQIAANSITSGLLAVTTWDSVSTYASTPDSFPWADIYGGGKPDDNATVGATWGTNLNSIPTRLQNSVSSTGVYIIPNYIGFYNSGTASWPIKIMNDSGVGKFFAGNSGTGNYVSYDGTTMTVRGSLTADDVTAGTFTGLKYQTGSSGQRVVLDTDGTLAFYDSGDTEIITLEDGVDSGNPGLRMAIDSPTQYLRSYLTNEDLYFLDYSVTYGEPTGSIRINAGTIDLTRVATTTKVFKTNTVGGGERMYITADGDIVTTGDATISGNIIIPSGTVDGVDLSAFYTAYGSHTHDSGDITGGSDTDFSVVTDIRFSNGYLQKKTRSLTLNNGIITAVGSESAWTNAIPGTIGLDDISNVNLGSPSNGWSLKYDAINGWWEAAP